MGRADIRRGSKNPPAGRQGEGRSGIEVGFLEGVRRLAPVLLGVGELIQAGIAALKGSLDSVKEQCRLYQERRDALCEGLRSIGWDLPNGKGTMFVWARIPGGRMDSMDFCMELMEKAGVIVTPGASFGPHGEGYVRFALVLPPEKIREAVEAIRRSGITD